MDISRLTRVTVLLTVAVAVLAGCNGVRRTYVPDGRRGYAIDCGGFLSSWSSCLVKAGRACGNNGYETIRGSEDDRSLLVACKVPAPAAH